MRNVFLFVVLGLVFGCDQDIAETNVNDSGDVYNDLAIVDLSLSPGNLSANDQFTEVELPLEVTEAYDLVPLQVGATISELNGHSPDFLRIEFTSNQIEWVGYSQNSLEIYDSEEECMEAEDYCDKVVVGEGTSGYFEIDSGHIAIQNAYCRFADSSYDFTITATVYDLTYWPIEAISDPVDILISCQMLDD